MLKASCHCGNINIDMPRAPEALVSCNCSICHRLGALWGRFAPEEVNVVWTEEAPKPYRWGDEYIDFQHCPRCGCVTHHTSTENWEEKRVTVNCRMLEPKWIANTPIKKFDGADTWEFIEE
ncbi:aldehyde-activating protein [Hahella aquimaris]|uniref:GFA family protein n=1 Tax=Hahella sp. HNIBRBA332 TaxID=3015983 RepID=UPI00273A8EE6|nr:aldehyde-activating protein [Hahella sp. HNIBRBA332]WLQ17041.1 aldehyde-activating protein [Hahella sp. HNIBRBA332]